MCGLFDAKPIFHGHTKTVDIVPMNPFSEPIDGGLPDVAKADGVLELHYGHNVKGITRTLNTENIVTKLYAYGSYGDKTSGYCGIDECTHQVFIYTLTESLQSGVAYFFTPEGHPVKTFVPSADISSGTKLYWSTMDPASMSYIWDSANNLSYPVTKGSVTCLVDSEGAVLIDSAGVALSSVSSAFPAEVSVSDEQNWFSFLMDFSYYQNVGLFSDDMYQALGDYQQNGAALYQKTNEAMQGYLDVYTDLTEVIGDVNFCKLNIDSFTSDSGYAKLNLNPDSVVYRTDYAAKERSLFSWTPAVKIDDKGDPTNATASVLYVIHDTTPVSWDKVYIQYVNDGVTEAQEGENIKNVTSLTLWTTRTDISLSKTDSFYLFEKNDINGLLGAWESADEAKLKTLASSTKVVTSSHPVYFTESEMPIINVNETNGYAWAWQYDPSGETEGQLYFHYGDGTDSYYATTWGPVYYTNYAPKVYTEPAYWYNWANLASYDSSTLYCLKNGNWVKATTDVMKSTGVTEGLEGVKDIPFDIEDTWRLFGTVYNSCRERDRLFQGYRQYETYTVTDPVLTAGNYYITDGYGDFYVFSVKEDLYAGATLTHDRFSGWIEQTTHEGIKSILEVKKYPFDGVTYNSDAVNLIIVSKEHYTLLQPLESSGDKRGIIHFIERFRELSDIA